jgi:hypothetical protein
MRAGARKGALDRISAATIRMILARLAMRNAAEALKETVRQLALASTHDLGSLCPDDR